jgi:hypothetical protein
MPRSPLAIVLPLAALALVAVPTALAKGPDKRAVRVQGTCTEQSTSKLKLGREDRGIEVEFEVDQNRNGVPWRVTLSRNGKAVSSFTATTRAPSGSFEARRVIAGRIGTDRITAVATRASGERCSAVHPGAKTAAVTSASVSSAGGASDNSVSSSSSDDSAARVGSDDGPLHDVGDDHGGGHEVGDDHGGHSGGHS